MSNRREKAEEKEKLVCEYIDDGVRQVRPSSKTEAQIAEEIIDYIKSETGEEPVEAIHIGDTYDSIGDIKVRTNTTSYYIELKILKQEGVSTLANITPQSILLADIFKGDIYSWKDFLDLHNHSENVINKLRWYPDYDEELLEECTTELKTKEKLGREVREEVKEDKEYASVASEIKADIESYDKEIKYKYFRHLSSFPINKENLKAFILILIAGYHKKKQIKEYMGVVDGVMEEYKFDDPGEVFEDYEVIYAYPNETGVEIKNGTQSNIIEDLASIPAEKFTIQFGGGDSSVTQTNMMAGFKNNGDFKSVIRFSLHWGNVFQGISTRRFNCFKGSYIRNQYKNN